MKGADFLTELAVRRDVSARECFDVEDEDWVNGALGGTIRTEVGEGERAIETNRVVGMLFVCVARSSERETTTGVPALKRGGNLTY